MNRDINETATLGGQVRNEGVNHRERDNEQLKEGTSGAIWK